MGVECQSHDVSKSTDLQYSTELVDNSTVTCVERTDGHVKEAGSQREAAPRLWGGGRSRNPQALRSPRQRVLQPSDSSQ